MLKQHWQWAGFGLLAVLICAIAIIAPAKISGYQLEREAETAANRISSELVSRPGYLLDALASPSLASRMNEMFGELGYAHRILRYELYDSDGKLVFTSGQSALDLDSAQGDTTAGAPAAPRHSRPSVSLYDGTGDGGPDHLAALTVPMQLSGSPQGTLVAFLDQSDQARAFGEYFSLITVITLLLLAIGIATPVTIAWMRSRERYQAEQQLRFLENHDALTGLPNRTAFTKLLSDSLNQMFRTRTHIAVLCVDVDKFKEINDMLDHSGGDAVLSEIARRIRTTMREGDLFGRLGGDEFAIALTDITNLADVMNFMHRLVDVMRAPFLIDGKEMVCTTSVGIALAPGDGESAGVVLKHADIALTRAKRDGGQRMCFFERSMDKALQRRRMVEHELRLALGRGEFDLLYQPQFSLQTEKQTGTEALIRWYHPVHGKIAPAHFISVAEDTGLIVPLGEWVLRRACSDAVKWPSPVTVAVNLSPAQFRDSDIAKVVSDILEETGLPPERLELEITENLLINDTEEVLQKLKTLRALGVAIAMDDFGTGFSSLSYLARFPFSKIKIDRQFIHTMTKDPAVKAIVKTIVALGKALGMTVTAEGVETVEQATMLREYGCPQVQGFLYSEPVSSEEAGRATPKVRTLRKQVTAVA
ncbi:bifunctional diguanylate cyclase/phosphodiesterase [Methyloligella sp. 2.7D]|nr:bifunctional diguanylate cyclase/phosphodiesterase [Methyloligella sp. GL2]